MEAKKTVVVTIRGQEEIVGEAEGGAAEIGEVTDAITGETVKVVDRVMQRWLI